MLILMQWIHLMAAVLGLGGTGFLLIVLIPSLGVLSPEQRAVLSKAMASPFRWATWSAMALLLISGIYNIRQTYWSVPWGTAWKFLTLKIVLSLIFFTIVLALTLPFKLFEPLRARRRLLVLVAFIVGVIVVLISAYLRRG